MTSNVVAYLSNKLAFVRIFCYFSRDIINKYIFVMRDLRVFRRGFATATAAGAAFAMSLSPAYAQEFDHVRTETPTTSEAIEQPLCAQPADEAYGCATEGYEIPKTLDEVKAMGRNMIIYHYGKGIEDAHLVAALSTKESSIPTIAIPGGPDNRVQAVISGWTSDKLIYTQSDLNRSTMSLQAERLYPRITAQQNAQASATSVSYSAPEAAGSR